MIITIVILYGFIVYAIFDSFLIYIIVRRAVHLHPQDIFRTGGRGVTFCLRAPSRWRCAACRTTPGEPSCVIRRTSCALFMLSKACRGLVEGCENDAWACGGLRGIARIGRGLLAPTSCRSVVQHALPCCATLCDAIPRFSVLHSQCLNNCVESVSS